MPPRYVENSSVLPSALNRETKAAEAPPSVDWIGATSGKSLAVVNPVTVARPAASTRMAAPSCAACREKKFGPTPDRSIPPRNVEYTSPVPVAFSLVTKTSLNGKVSLPQLHGIAGVPQVVSYAPAVEGKLGLVVHPVTYASPLALTA